MYYLGDYYPNDLPTTVWLREIEPQYGCRYFEDMTGIFRRANLQEVLRLFDENGLPEVAYWQWLKRWGAEWVAIPRDGHTHFMRVATRCEGQ